MECFIWLSRGGFTLPVIQTPLHLRLSWRWKALIPLLCLALFGMFLLVRYVPSYVLSWHIFLISTLVAILIVILLVLFIVLVDRPLHELRRSIVRASQGDLTAQVRFAKRSDEIGELGSDFNRMVSQIHQDCEQCDRLHRAQMREAEHLATLGEVAAGLAHEIKNPLAGISGVIDVVADEYPSDHPNREALRQGLGECDRIRKLVNDLLSYAKPKQPSIEWADLNATVESAAQFSSQIIASKDLRLEICLDPALPSVWHDPHLIRGVVVNLLLNGVQASEPGGKIHLQTRLDGLARSAEVVVRDHGHGIPAELQNRIFQPFFTTKGPEGTGLGLSLCKRIVEQHGGAIQVRSVPGQTTEFTVSLPAHVSEMAVKV